MFLRRAHLVSYKPESKGKSAKLQHS